jgi:hypothetical protein
MTNLIYALQFGTQFEKENHQKLLFEEGRDSNKWNKIANDPFYSDMMCELRSLRNDFITSPNRSLPYSLYALFEQTGVRSAYEEEYFDHRQRMNVFAALALCDGGNEIIKALEDAIWAICDEYTWCLPAHLGGKSLVSQSDSAQMPDGRDQRHSLDLFASETAFALSEILSLLGEKLSELVVFRARQETFDRVLDSYMSLAPACWWESCDMNWAAVCSGSIGAAAMYLIDDDETLCPLMERVLQTMECYLAGFPEDGACLEGVGYWTYGFGFFTYFSTLLKQRTAGKIDLMKHPTAQKVALFQQKSFLLGDQVISYADAEPVARYMPGLTHKLKSVYKDFEVPPSSSRGGLFDECNRWPVLVRNLVWSDELAGSEKLRDAYYVFDRAGIVVSRKITAPSVAFSAKGGHNDEPHNHNDLGSFIFCVGGKSLLVDPGGGIYSKQYFSEGRYDILSNSSRGHSVPIIDGRYQQAGREHEAKVLECKTDGIHDLFALDLTRAYDAPNLAGLIRSFRFDKAQASLILCDEYHFESEPASVVERFVSFCRSEIIGKGRIRLSDGEACIDIIYDSSVLRCDLGSEKFLPNHSERETLYRIDLHVEKPVTEMRIEIGIHTSENSIINK